MTHTRIMSAIGAGVVLLDLAGMTNATAFMLPGIPPSGLPNFENNARVEVKSFGDDFLLTAQKRTGPFLFRLGAGAGQQYTVMNASFRTRAIFDDDGELESGSVRITGRIPKLSGFGNPNGLLYLANLVDFNLPVA
ncbi:MAG: hypothetical protein ACREXS_02335 [Gammaproteobacteria bacterium]